jgi:hypothetical protein
MLPLEMPMGIDAGLATGKSSTFSLIYFLRVDVKLAEARGVPSERICDWIGSTATGCLSP